MSEFHKALTTLPFVIGVSVVLVGVLGLLHCNVWPMVILVGCQLMLGGWKLWNIARKVEEPQHGNK